MAELTKCLWCRGRLPIASFGTADYTRFDCETCGKYVVPNRLVFDDTHDFFEVADDSRYLVAAWLRHRTRNELQPVLVTKDDAQNIVANSPKLEPWDKALKLLLVFAELSQRPGTLLGVHQIAFPDAVARDDDELQTYMNWLGEAGYTEDRSNTTFYITKNGWQEISQLQQRHAATGKRAFVAMWFHDSMDKAFTDGIAAACNDAGYDAYRVKEDLHGEKIDARIIAAIREARFVIADVTGDRSAVYYEAGFAEGLGKQVIWACRRDKKEDMNFDTRQYSHILWEDEADLRAKLVPMIKARIV